MTTRLSIVGCSQSKHDPDEWGKAHPDHEEGDDVDTLPLRYLYKRSYWVVKHDYAKAVPDDWRVLSAGLGLAHPDRVMEESYDKTLHKMTDEEIQAWVDDLEPDLREWVQGHAEDDDVVVDVLLGQEYLGAIEPILNDLPIDIAYPFEGTSGNGQQMSQLNAISEQYQERGEVDIAAVIERDED